MERKSVLKSGVSKKDSRETSPKKNSCGSALPVKTDEQSGLSKDPERVCLRGQPGHHGVGVKGRSGRKRCGLGGDIRSKQQRWMFNRYLKNITSAETFLSKGGVKFYRQFSVRAKEWIRKRLKEVDPEGLEKFRRMMCQGRFHRKRKKQMAFIASEGPQEDLVALSHIDTGMEGVSRIRFMHLGGLKNVLAICLAAGYRPDEVAAMAQMDVTDLTSLVSKEDIKAAVREMPEAITMAADQMVMRDLLKGEATEMTSRADLIASRRRKTALDVSAEVREIRRESSELRERREKHLVDRFGVDRQKGETIDVEADKKEEQKPD